MATFNVANSIELRNAIQLAGAGDDINLTGPGPYSVGTLAKFTSTTLTTVAGTGYKINGGGNTITDTRIYQENIDGRSAPALVDNVIFSYSGAAANTTAIFRASNGGPYTISNSTFTGAHSGWSGNGSTYFSLNASPTSSTSNVELTFSGNTVNLSGQGKGPGGNNFDGTSGGAAFMQSWNNAKNVTLQGNNFDEGSVASGGYLASFHFMNLPAVSDPATLGTYTISGNTFSRSVNKNLRTRGNRLENVKATLTGNTFSDGAYLDIYGKASSITIGNGITNTFNTISNGVIGCGIRLNETSSTGATLTGLPTFVGTTTFTGTGTPVRYVNAAAGTGKTLTGTFSISFGSSLPATFTTITAGGQGADTLTGDANSNYISGDAGNDTINGGGGVDFIYGGAGADELTGGGVDEFQYLSPTEGTDTITDYVSGSGDQLGFLKSAFGNINTVTLGTNLFNATGPTGTNAQFVFDGTTNLLTFYANGTAGSGSAIATLTGVSTLQNVDFVMF